MAGLPRYQAHAILENTGVIRFDSAGRGLDVLGAVAGNVAAQASAQRQQVADAELAGSNTAVTRDEQGNLQVRLYDNSSAANRAYNEAALARYAADFSLDNQRIAAELHARHLNDPAGFDAEWQGRMQGALQQVPPQARGLAETKLQEIGQQHYGNLLLNKAAADRGLAEDSLKNLLTRDETDYYNLAEAGQLKLDKATRTLAEIRTTLDGGVKSGFWSKEHADLVFDRITSEANGRLMIAQNQETMRVYGPMAAFQQAMQFERDPTLLPNLTADRRAAIVNEMQSRIRDQIFLTDKMEAATEKYVKQAQQDKTGELWSMLGQSDTNGRPALTRAMIEQARANRQIDLQQYQSLIDRTERTDNPGIYVDLLLKIKNGQATQNDIITERRAGNLSIDTTKTFLGELDQQQRNPGVFASHDYRSAVDRLKESIITTGPLAALDPDQQMRFGSAVRELDDTIRQRDIGLANPTMIWPIVEDLVARYRTAPPSLQSLPQSHWGAIKSMDDVNKASAWVFENYVNGTLDDNTANYEDQLLMQYRHIFERQGQLDQLSTDTGAQADEARKRAEEAARQSR